MIHVHGIFLIHCSVAEHCCSVAAVVASTRVSLIVYSYVGCANYLSCVFLLQVSTVALNLLEASTVFVMNRAGRISTLSVKLINQNFVCSCSYISKRSEVGKRSVSRYQRDNVKKCNCDKSSVK
jgi:hypothetical protein